MSTAAKQPGAHTSYDPMIQPGPCIVCGATNYPLSTGGPTVCAPCDCGHYNQGRLANYNVRLTARVAELEAALRLTLDEAIRMECLGW